MTKKADFNADEWSTLVEAPVLAGMRVVTAGRGGTIRETMAMGKIYAAARQQQGESELLDDLISSPPAMDPKRVGSTGDVKGAAEERLREAVGILEAKATPEERDAYKRFVVTLAASIVILVPLQRRIVATPHAKTKEIEEMRARWFRGHLGRSMLAAASFVAVAVAATL